MWQFHPAIWRDGVLTELPRPVSALRLLDSWDYERFKTPVADGDHAAGHSRNGVDIQLEGQLGTVAGAVQAGETEMFAAAEALRQALNVGSAADRYFLALYHDTEAGLLRGFQKCTTVRFESDLSDKALFAYSIVVHASDPVLQTTSLD